MSRTEYNNGFRIRARRQAFVNTLPSMVPDLLSGKRVKDVLKGYNAGRYRFERIRNSNWLIDNSVSMEDLVEVCKLGLVHDMFRPTDFIYKELGHEDMMHLVMNNCMEKPTYSTVAEAGGDHLDIAMYAMGGHLSINPEVSNYVATGANYIHLLMYAKLKVIRTKLCPEYLHSIGTPNEDIMQACEQQLVYKLPTASQVCDWGMSIDDIIHYIEKYLVAGVLTKKQKRLLSEKDRERYLNAFVSRSIMECVICFETKQCLVPCTGPPDVHVPHPVCLECSERLRKHVPESGVLRCAYCRCRINMYPNW